MNNYLCRLCEKKSPLRRSHIIPKFVYRWKVSQSVTNAMRRIDGRDSDGLNRRVQDGERRHWLCESCEKVFGRWEREFSNSLFYPYVQRKIGPVQYGDWLLKFCTSVSWRVLQLDLEKSGQQTTDATILKKQADIVWREFLLGKRSSVTSIIACQQYFFPLSAIHGERVKQVVDNISRNINRYIQNHIETFVTDECVYTKLGPFYVIGVIDDNKYPYEWSRTRISKSNGCVDPSNYPLSFLEFLNARATFLWDNYKKISLQQKAKIKEHYHKNQMRMRNSDQMIAMDMDVEMFGEDAFQD